MAKNIYQVYQTNPIASNESTDLMYFGRSPYNIGDDTAMLFSDFALQFGAPYVPAALTKSDDTNVTLSLGGTPNTALLQPVSLTLGWSGQLSPARGGTGVNNGASTLTIGGNFQMTGAFTFNGTLTGNTSVTFPTSGTLTTTASASGHVTSGTINELSWYAATGDTVSGLPTANNSVLVTNGVGVPSISNTLPSSLNIPNPNINDGNGNPLLRWSNSGSPNGWLQINNAGTSPGISSIGTGTNLNLGFSTKGTGAFTFFQSSSSGAFMTFSAAGGSGLSSFKFPVSGTADYTFPNATGTIALTSQIPSVTPSALTKTDDTNVTLTLGGTPSTALLQATSLTLGWSGQLSPSRGGTGINNGTNTLTLAGNLATSGAFNSTFTMTGATNVTFPTSGTLATIGTAITQVTKQVFTGSGTYTPTTGMKYCIIECWGSGGGGSGVANSSATGYSIGGGGGSGSYSRLVTTAATIGASQAVTIATGGAGGSAGPNSGSPGSSSSVGTLCIANGGSGGAATVGGAGGSAGTGDITGTGFTGGSGVTSTITTISVLTGMGASSTIGGGGAIRTTQGTGNAATGFAAGGAGGLSSLAAGTAAGGAGSGGFVIITEYI